MKERIGLIGCSRHCRNTIEQKMFKDCQKTDLKNAKYLEERVVNIPSSVRL